MNTEEEARPSCIYPVYINSKIDRAAGRRLPKSKCVEDPNIKEIFDVCVAWGADCKPEPLKSHPRVSGRSWPYYSGGRIRVPYRTINVPRVEATDDEVGELKATLEQCRLNGEIEKITKREFLIRLCEGIRRYRARKALAKEAEKAAAPPAPQSKPGKKKK